MAKVTYIQGTNPPQQPDVSGVTTLWHIRKPRTSHKALCGVDVPGELKRRNNPMPGAKAKKELCGFCSRIADGRHPVFDKATDDLYRRTGVIGTRAHPDHTDEVYAATAKQVG